MEVSDFTSPEVRAFAERYEHFLWGAYNDVAYDILMVLDTCGGDESSLTSSHVRGDKTRWEKNMKPWFRRLSGVTIRTHSLHVAEEISRLVGDQELLKPVALLAALAHDIGKFKRLYRRSLAITPRRAHAVASAKAMEAIIAGRLSPNVTAIILDAVGKHHNPEDVGGLIDILKRADTLARLGEAGGFDQGDVKIETPTDPAAPTANTPAKIRKARPRNNYKPEPVNRKAIPFWSVEEYLKILARHVNNPIHKGMGAFSMPDGICYFYTTALFAALKDLCVENGADLIAELWESEPQKFVDAVGFICSELVCVGALATALVPPGKTGGPFLIFFKKDYMGSKARYFVPIKASALTHDIRLLESRKGYQISSKFAYVKPYMPKNRQEGETDENHHRQ